MAITAATPSGAATTLSTTSSIHDTVSGNGSLLFPPPTFFPLTAALLALQEQAVGETVFLIDVNWLSNWFIWAFHCPAPEGEGQRVREALRHAAMRFGLVPPSEQMISTVPGPINSSSLSVVGHPLLLSPSVEVMRPHQSDSVRQTMARAVSDSALATIPPKSHGKRDEAPTSNGNIPKIYCLAVPEAFYEALRSVHGVLCEDRYSVSFQRFTGDSERILLYHQQYHNSTHRSADSHESLQAKTRMIASVTNARPVEFRRKVIFEPQQPETKEPASLMEKLLREEQSLRKKLFPTVEVHPIKLVYHIVMDDSHCDLSTISSGDRGQAPESGFCLVSRGSPAFDALGALLRVAAPNKATSNVRLWSKASAVATKSGDGYECVDLEMLQYTKNTSSDVCLVQEWLQRQSPGKEWELLIETRRTVNSSWPREELELSRRLQVGDYVDAQDVAGKWYEAVITALDETTVTVHYFGWASRWDSRIKRFKDSPLVDGVVCKVAAPAPLWSQTGRWREQIKVGDTVEIRDSSSIVERPKWYTGIVKTVGRPSDPPRMLDGGTELEKYSIGGEPEAHLLLLARTQQILVEVEQERTDKAALHAQSEGETRPPHVRWVNLYGEEICQINTHLKHGEVAKPVTLRYEYENHRQPVEILKSSVPNLGAGFVRESLRGTPPAPGSVGLHNLGNSCFLNSTLQCLNHIEPITQYFLQNKYAEEINRMNPLGSGGNVATAYGSLIKKIWSGEYSVLAPRLLKQTVAKFAPQFDNCYQHDSQEFCQFLMDGLHEDLNRVKSKPYVEELEGFGMDDSHTAIESWRKHLLRHDSIIVDHCQGMHRSHLTCPHCGRESIKFDVFSSISLPLVTSKRQATIKLEDCIEKFMEGEQLDERNAWYCPSCRKHVCALKMIALWSVPDILILHLKRFTFDTCMTSGNMLRSKIDAKVEFPIDGLDLTKNILGPIDPEAPPIYKLFGVSEHVGPTANSGHYTATVRNSINGQWYRCNDSHVGLTSGEASITGGAYLLFYQRSKGLSRWGGLANVMEERGINPYGGLETDQEGFMMVKNKKKKPPKY